MINLTILGIRLLALYVFLQAIIILESITFLFQDEFFRFEDSWQIFTRIAYYLIISSSLFFGSNKLANMIIPNSKDQESRIDDYQKISAILFSTVGLFIIYWSIESITQSLASILYMEMIYPDNPDPNIAKYRVRTFIYGGFIQLILGIALFIGGKKLAKWWYDFRNWT